MTMWLLTEPRAADMDNPEPGALCRPRRGRSATVIVLQQFGQTPAGIGKAEIVSALDKYPSSACGVAYGLGTLGHVELVEGVPLVRPSLGRVIQAADQVNS